MLNYKTYIQDKELPWVVFVHGAGGNVQTWRRQINEFREHFNLLTIELRDHGDSALPSHHKYSFDIIIEDLKEVLDHEGITKAHFVTFSFGSVFTLYFSLKYPGYVDKIVNAGGVFWISAPLRIITYIVRFLSPFLPYRLIYQVFSYILMPYARHQASRRVYWLQAKKIKQDAYLRWLGMQHEFFKVLRKFKKQHFHFPILIVMGSEDYTFLNAARAFADRTASASLSLIPMTSHTCHMERPDLFNSLAIDFLRK